MTSAFGAPLSIDPFSKKFGWLSTPPVQRTMPRTLRFTAPALLLASMVGTLFAESTVGPPTWNDKASVYLAMSPTAADAPATEPSPTATSNNAPTTVYTPAPSDPATLSATVAPTVDTAVTPAVHEMPAETQSPKADDRYLAPPSSRFAPVGDATSRDPSDRAGAASHRLADFGVPAQSLYTILAALAIVIGSFLLFTWALKRSSRGKSARGALPADVVCVLGRVPLAAQQFAELLRVGNKLVLVSLTATGAAALTEVTDPAEVDRLVGLCQQGNPFSTSKAFEQVFQQMSTEPAPNSFLGNEALMTSLSSPVGAYRANRGGSARA